MNFKLLDLLRLSPKSRAFDRSAGTSQFHDTSVMTYPLSSLTESEQSAHHAGDLAMLNAALREISRLSPDNPILQPEVARSIYESGVTTFRDHGWKAAIHLEVDPHSVHNEHLIDFEGRRQRLITALAASPIEHQYSRFLLLFRKVQISWRGRIYPTLHAATAAKNAELARLRACSLGDALEQRPVRA